MKKMKYLCSCILFCLLANICLPTFANPITKDSAQIKAEQLFRYNGNALGRQLIKTNIKQELVCVRENRSSENEDATYYIFSRQGKPGFAIIAGDDCMPALIGYSLENNIDVDNMPDALKLMLNDYDLYVNYLRENGKASIKSNVGPLEPGTPIVGPYIQSTWNQGPPYNWLTPVDGTTGNHMVTGCVPTAAAQILNYYKWPQNSYYRVYNWNDMQNSYGNGYSDAEGMAVATLMRDLGAIMGTHYGTYESGGSGTSAAFDKIPGYICTQISDLVENLAKGPLAIIINDYNNSFSHAVITDGYDSNGFFHINWGWGGSCDGYYNWNDLAIIYNKKEIHPSVHPYGKYLLEPDINNDKHLSVPAALGGINIDKLTAAIGDKVTVSLHNLKLFSGSEFNGYFALFIYKAPQESYNGTASMDGYYGEQVYGIVQYADKKYTDFEDSAPWNNSLDGKDFNVSITSLPQLSSNGNYVLVPVCFNTMEASENSGVRGGEWRPLLQFADGTLAEDIPFEYQNGNYIFKEVPHGDFKIDVSQIATASTYREKGKSSILASIKNEGCNNFTGTMTATLVNTNDERDIKTIDYSLYVPANHSSHVALNTIFDFTGTYSIKNIEIWKSLPTGNRQTYLNKSINGTLFTILPYDSQAVTTDFFARANIEIVRKNDTYCVNDSIYKYEEANMQFYAYSLDADTAVIDAELWAVPVNEGLPSLLKKKNYPLSKQYIRTHKIGGSTANLSPGSYYLKVFGRCGNNTTVFSQPDTIGKGYQNLTDAITDNIIHISDPGVEIPILKLQSYKQINDFYYGKYNYLEAEIENSSDADYYGHTSNCFSIGNNSYLSVYSTPFRIKARQTATIFPELYQYKDYEGTGGNSKGNFMYKVNNGVRDLIIPMEGDFTINFMETPKNIINASSSIAFYYKDNLSIKPYLGFYSKGILKRTLWKSDETVMVFDDLQTDSTYNTYNVCPEASEIKDLPSGNYLLKINLTDINGENPTIIYPLIIDDEVLPLSIEKVSFDTNRSFSYEGDMPVVVSIKNPTQQSISTLVSTEILRKVDGENSWWGDTRELHPITLPAMQSTTINLNAHILSANKNLRQDGTFKVNVSVCRTLRESGHLDFGPIKGSDTIELPYVSDGILQNTNESHRIPIAYYTIDGKRVSTPPHGIYIVRYSDGSVKKCVNN